MTTLPRRMLALAFAAALLLMLGLAAIRASADMGADPGAASPDEAVLLTAPDPAGATPDAALLAELGGGYLSPVTAAPRPFTHLLLRWEASQPVSATVQLEVRASLDGETWTEWGAVLENADLWVPEDGPELFWGQEIYAGEGARYWQVRAQLLPAPDGAMPALRRVNVFTVDGRYGPPEPAADLPSDLVAPEAGLSSIARPPVVSRTAWGSPDGQGSRVAPSYRAVRHMVVHHTADSNSLTGGQRWSDRVRAIWSFHTITRGWGDIGYNFLIDPNGVIYEGRAGGDDAVGFHDTANFGSMGVALIGTYGGAPPPGSAQESLVGLLAWKADQKDIDPLGRAFYYGCSISEFCNPFNQGSVVPNISGHRDVTPGRTTCPGDGLHALLPQLRERVRQRLGGDAQPDPEAKLELLGVSYDRTTVAAGELLKVTFTVKNSGSVALESQAPEAPRDQATGSANLAESYVYDEGECFLGATGRSYPTFPKETGRVRVILGPAEEGRQPACDGGTGGYPWRWGLNGTLAPGAVREVVGYVRLSTPGTLTLRAGAINEYVSYLAEGAGAQAITVTPERQAPAPAAYDELLRPLASVYRVESAPENLLARSLDASTPPRGAFVGSFPWLGEHRDWGEGGPLATAPDVADQFIVEQTRAFYAPVAGTYTFRVVADDGGWLWVNGRHVASGRSAQGGGLVGSVELPAGTHVLAFRAYERTGGAQMGYTVQVPGATGFVQLSDGLSSAAGGTVERFGATYRRFGGLTLAAADLGGTGVAALRYSLNGAEWVEATGATAQIGALPDGQHTVRYVAVDGAGNQSEERALSFRIDPALAVQQLYLPLVTR